MNAYSTSFSYASGPALLPRTCDSTAWCGSDSEQLYRANCKLPPPGWAWQYKPVHYTWNPEGYRSPSWHTVDWPSTHVVMGCSHVMGVGVTDTDTLTSQLSQQLGEATVNLGYAGGSCQMIQYNTMRMMELAWRPKSVTIVIPQLSRVTYFDDSAPRSFIPMHLNQKDPGIVKFYEYWLRPQHHAELYSRMAILGSVAMWGSLGVPVILRHWHHDPDEQQLAAYLPAVVDHARDLQTDGAGGYFGHPGPATLALWAHELADEIRLL